MSQIDDYLRRINPVYRDQNNRWVIGSESRQCTYKAVAEVLRSGGATADYQKVVAATCAAAQRHGAEIKLVWRHVRRVRDQLHYRAEQLTLPL
jgi:hypothetical protein